MRGDYLFRLSRAVRWCLPPAEAAEVLDQLIRKKCRGELSDPREKKRVSDALLRRGFAWSDVKAAMGRYTEMLEDTYD